VVCLAGALTSAVRPSSSIQRLCEFLDVPYRGHAMPHLNRSA
jgi:hypothetical protein